MEYIEDPVILSQEVSSLELEISTVDAHDAPSGDSLYVNIVFSDGTRLYDPVNYPAKPWIPLPIPGLPMPGRGEKMRFKLPVPTGLGRTLGDIVEVFLRKNGTDGWFVGSVLLFANAQPLPLLGNSNVNQFLDNNDDVLMLREWSTASLCVAPATPAIHPLVHSGYRVLGPVIGQVSSTSANVLFRVDREGDYRFVAVDGNGNIVHDETHKLEPTHRFRLTGLQPNKHYEFDLRLIRAGIESIVPDSTGSLITYPTETSHGLFTFAFGSCVNPNEQVAQGSWSAIRSLAQVPPAGINPVHLFIHLGDTFYFYDDNHIIEEIPVSNVETMRGAHVSMRRHIEFLDMARVVPSCGVWDDHDFAGCDLDSTSISAELRKQAAETWLEYWGNQLISSKPEDMLKFGLTTRISHGLVDIYLLDGRFNRNMSKGICFGKDIINIVLETIDRRGDETPRVVVLGTGSNWNHHPEDKEDYGHSIYHDEREMLYKELASRMGNTINGLILISGDNHINEIFHVKIDEERMAPEFVSTPLTLNTGLKSDGNEIQGERIASFPSGGENGKRGFTTLTINTSGENPNNWKATVRYYLEAAALPYDSRSYILSNGQFDPL